MVVYDLICGKKHRFEGWFPSFEDYQNQAAQGQISCPTCGTTRVEKMPHACAVHLKRETKKEPKKSKETPPPQPPSPAEVKELLIRLHHHIREKFEDVGPHFAETARQIFYGKAEERSIHGTSTPEERRGLDEEGIPYLTIPKPDLDS